MRWVFAILAVAAGVQGRWLVAALLAGVAAALQLSRGLLAKVLERENRAAAGFAARPGPVPAELPRSWTIAATVVFAAVLVGLPAAGVPWGWGIVIVAACGFAFGYLVQRARGSRSSD